MRADRVWAAIPRIFSRAAMDLRSVSSSQVKLDGSVGDELDSAAIAAASINAYVTYFVMSA
jgi:hypothetical protein